MIDFVADYLIFQPFKPSRNRIQHTITAANPDTYPDRNLLKYLLTIRVPDYPGSDTYVDLVTIPNREKPPVVEGITSRYDGANFVFDSLLDGLMKRTKPTFRLSAIAATSQLTTPFRLTETVEYNGSTAYSNALVASYAAKVGFTESDFDQWGTRFFSTYLSQYRQFLTWQPNNKRVTEAQEEYLYFLLNFTPTPTTIKLRVKAIYADASEQLLTPLQLSGVQFGQVICVPVGAYIIGANPEKTLQSYQVWLSNELNDRLSEVRTYHLEYRTFAQERSLLFSNSFNTFDTLRLTGVSTEALQVKRYSAYREKPLYLPDDFTEFFVVDRGGDRELTISTGFFERNVATQLRYLDELLMTEECYLITDRNHEPLELITNSLIDHNDTPDLVARQFQFRYVKEQKSFSRLPASPPFAARPIYWKPSGVAQVLDALGKRTGLVRPVKIVKTYQDDDTVVLPYTSKPNTVGDPDYIEAYLDPEVVVGSTPYPSAELSQATIYTRNNCPVGYFGAAATIVIPAGKYGGEEPGTADAMAEADYDSLNTQEYANENGACNIFYTSAALSRQSNLTRNNCSGSQAGTRWTITVAAGAYTGPTQAEADALAAAYADTLDTQAAANANGSCVAGQLYSLTPAAGKANLRVFENKSRNYRIRETPSGSTVSVVNNASTDMELIPGFNYWIEMFTTGGSFEGRLYKNGVLVDGNWGLSVGANSGDWFGLDIGSYLSFSAGDLLYFIVVTQA